MMPLVAPYASLISSSEAAAKPDSMNTWAAASRIALALSFFFIDCRTVGAKAAGQFIVLAVGPRTPCVWCRYAGPKQARGHSCASVHEPGPVAIPFGPLPPGCLP